MVIFPHWAETSSEINLVKRQQEQGVPALIDLARLVTAAATGSGSGLTGDWAATEMRSEEEREQCTLGNLADTVRHVLYYRV